MSIGEDTAHRFVHKGRTVYRWSQDLELVHIEIPDLPPGATKKDLAVQITKSHLTVGLVGLSPYLDVSLAAWRITCPEISVSERSRLDPCLLVGRLCSQSKGRRIVLDCR